MKSYKNLFSKIVTFENLLDAFYKAARGKREKDYVMDFYDKLEDNLLMLQVELNEQTYCPGKYKTFRIYEPKPRIISASPFRDRVVHHALINIVGPLLEKSLIFDSYANRVGKGTHRAIRRYQQSLRSYSYVLKCDIKKFFPSIDHEMLKSLLGKKISDGLTLWLIEIIIDGSNEQELINDYFPGDNLLTPLERRKGLPIGNLTSQLFANYYLNPFDHYVKEILKCPGYIRYVDDFVLFSNSKCQLQRWHEQLSDFLESYRLRLNPKRQQLYPSEIGNRILGQIVYKNFRRISGKNLRRFRKRLRKWEKSPPENLKQRIASWVGHASQADSDGLLKSFSHSIIKELLRS